MFHPPACIRPVYCIVYIPSNQISIIQFFKLSPDTSMSSFGSSCVPKSSFLLFCIFTTITSFFRQNVTFLLGTKHWFSLVPGAAILDILNLDFLLHLAAILDILNLDFLLHALKGCKDIRIKIDSVASVQFFL